MPTRSQAGNTPLFELGRDGTPLVIIDSTPPAQMTTPLPLPPPVSVSQVGYAVSLTSESDSAPVDQVSAVASSPSVTVETTPDPERGGPPPIPVGSSPSQGRAGPESSEAESGAKRRKTKGPASVKIPGGVSGLIDYLNAHLDKAGQDSIPSHGGQAVYDAINKLASLGSEPKANPVATPWSGDAMREINLMKWTEMISDPAGMKSMSFDKVYQAYTASHSPLPPGTTISVPFEKHCLVIKMYHDVLTRHQNEHEFLRAFDLAEWVNATGGTCLFKTTPAEKIKIGEESKVFSGREKLVMEKRVVGHRLSPVKGAPVGKPGSIPGVVAETTNSGDTRLYTVVEHPETCAGSWREPENLMRWSSDPAGACIQPGTGTPNLSYLYHHDTDQLVQFVGDVFTNPMNYIDHWHYYTAECAQIQGYVPQVTPALPAYSIHQPDPAHKVPGINTPYIYSNQYGTKSIFGTHVEDLGLASLNTLIHGEPKVWLTVAPAHESTVTTEMLAKVHVSVLNRHSPSCSQAVRQINALMPPAMLDAKNATRSWVVQFPGDIVYVAPYTLHCGVNWGGNLAVAINLEGGGPQGVGCCCPAQKYQLNGANAMFHT